MNRVCPSSHIQRTRLRRLAHEFASDKMLEPPLPLNELEKLATKFLKVYNLDPSLRDWIMIELHNGIWMPTVASIPHERRLLLLPKCLRNAADCKGEMDDLGLLCHNCGRCVIPDLQQLADSHGMLSMVAEGFTSVIELIRQHVVDAVIGVSCIDSLEKAFPLLVSHAVPGIAIALNDRGCHNTHVDTDYVAELLPQRIDQTLDLLDYDKIRSEVDKWFAPESLSQILTPATDTTTRASLQWMLSGGRRWRPFLLTAVFAALSKLQPNEFPEEVKLAAIAVECFHKASLIHDDIQDNDLVRYGQPTIHARYGQPMAINIGDLLLGEGYRILASLPNKEYLSVVANAHVSLCIGQGAELSWHPNHTITIQDVIQIFRQKTVPAFEVALKLGLISANGDSGTAEMLHRYSENLGIAYQLKDDLHDISDEHTDKPSAVKALQLEHPQATTNEIEAMVSHLANEDHTRALTALGHIDSFELKRMLFQATEKILGT